MKFLYICILILLCSSCCTRCKRDTHYLDPEVVAYFQEGGTGSRYVLADSANPDDTLTLRANSSISINNLGPESCSDLYEQHFFNLSSGNTSPSSNLRLILSSKPAERGSMLEGTILGTNVRMNYNYDAATNTFTIGRVRKMPSLDVPGKTFTDVLAVQMDSGGYGYTGPKQTFYHARGIGLVALKFMDIAGRQRFFYLKEYTVVP